MDSARYRIVFRGDVALGYDSTEIRENISRLTRWDVKKIDQLLGSSECVIKSDLDGAAAERMLTALNNTGIICRKERMPESASPVPAAPIAVVGRAAIGSDDDAEKKCPQCGAPHEGGTICPKCGIVFAKFGQSRAAVASKPVLSTKIDATQAAVFQRRGSKRRQDPLAKLEESHPLGYYLGKLFLATAIALLLRSLYNADLTVLIFVLLPVGFALYLGTLSAVIERPFGELLAEHRTLLPIPFFDHERRGAALPLATYGLILLHLVIYLAFQLRTPVDTLQQSWFFLPLDDSSVTLVVSAFLSLFLHASVFAFLVGIFFLWVIGATLERRIGSISLVALYLFCGLFASVAGVGVQQLFPGTPLPIMGTGGALAGLIGVFAIRSRSRSMTFSLPFFGLDSIVKGTSYQVRWSALLIAGLVCLADLGAPAEANAEGQGSLGFVIYFSGLLSGLLAAYVLGFGNQAGEEEAEGLPGSQVFAANEGALRRRLEANPDNPDLQVQLARVIAEPELTDEARQLYRRAIIGRLSTKPKEATEIYREFTLRHQEVFEPKLTLRLASLYLRQGDTGMAAGVLSSVCADERTTLPELEKALYQYCVTIATLGEIDEAHMTLKRFSETFPESSLLAKLRDLVYDATQGEAG